MSQPCAEGTNSLPEPNAEPSALADLIARVEAATGPDREIDCALACHLDGFWAQLTPFPNRDKTIWRVDFCKREDGGIVSPGHGGDQMVRHYSRSLDAALGLAELVLPGSDGIVEFGNRPVAVVFVDGEEGPEAIAARAPTPALALVLAILKARSQDGTTEPQGQVLGGPK